MPPPSLLYTADPRGQRSLSLDFTHICVPSTHFSLSLLGGLTSPTILRSEGTSNEKAEQAMAALTHATEMHPQHPRHDIHIEYEGVVTPVIILSRYSNTSSLLYFLLTLILFSIQSQVEMTNNEIEAKI